MKNEDNRLREKIASRTGGQCQKSHIPVSWVQKMREEQTGAENRY